MTSSDSRSAEERRIANLQAVASHLARKQVTPPVKEGESMPGQGSWARRLRTLGPLGIALAFILSKLKLIIPLLKLTKLGTLLSMFVAVWAYALFWGWPFAVGFVLLIFVHEMGHAVVLRQQGIHAGAPVFIPFVGAVIAMKGRPRDAYVEALVGIGGPILGSMGALACLVVGGLTGSAFWFALAWVGFMLNLFNLIPISPLDGGRIAGVISRWLWVVGYILGGIVFFFTRSPILFLVLLLGVFNLKNTIRGPHREYFEVEANKRIGIGAAYFALMIALVIGMRVADEPLSKHRMLEDSAGQQSQSLGQATPLRRSDASGVK
jgi:Zn-dependent protease